MAEPIPNWKLDKAIRESNLKTQARLSFETGVSTTDLSRIINGLRIPTPKQKEAIAKALDIPESSLF